MTAKLFVQAIGKFLFGLILIGLLLFLPAWSLKYWNGWLFLGILFVPMFIAGIVMMFKNPELLKKRLNAKEEEQEQKTVIALSGLMFLAAFISACAAPLPRYSFKTYSAKSSPVVGSASPYPAKPTTRSPSLATRILSRHWNAIRSHFSSVSFSRYAALTTPAYASCQQDQCTCALPRISGSFSIFLIMICIYYSDQSVAEANNAT